MKNFFLILGVLSVLAIQACADNWRVVPVSSLQKLTAKTRGQLESFSPVPAQLKAARGEWECFQIVVTAGEKPLRNLRLKSTPLATHLGEFIALKNLQIYRENFVFVDKPSGNARMEKLWWPDALIPLDLQTDISIAPHTSEVFWVAVYAPQDAAPGLYYGAIDLSADNQTPRSLFVSLEVQGIQMPAPTMRATVAVYYDVLKDWYAKNLDKPFDENLKKKYYDFLLDYRINAYDLPVEWSTPEAANYLRDPRVLSVRLPPLAEKAKLQTALGVLRANNALHKNFYYWIDEPAPQEYSRVRETARELHALEPQIKQCVTVHPNQSLQGAVDIWCPNIGDFFGLGHLDFSMLQAERNKGNGTWWYTMIEPKYPYPTWLLDDDAMSVRSYGALMARYGITGFVYSMAHGWGPKPLENLQSFAGTNGDGTLLYPSELAGGSGPMPSIRLMLLRDAIEDYELMRAGLKPVPKMPNGLLREKIVIAKISIAQNSARAKWARQASPLQFMVLHDTDTLFVTIRADASTLEKDWCAVELAPPDLKSRFRFVVTSKGNGVVEKHTREGRFRLENFDWKFSSQKTETGYSVEMQIPLSVVNSEKQFRFNALRRSGSTLQITRAFPDAGDVTLMPIATLQ
jgi:hypothetical protein